MNHLVVARYQEDQSWYADIPDDWTLMEVQKGRELPNTGREASSYLWAIIKLYPDLRATDRVAFVQGDPFQHCQDIDLRLLLARRCSEFVALGDYTYVSGGDGLPHHPGIDVAGKYEEWLGDKWPGAVRFTPGAQFMVTGENIRRYPLSFYEQLMDDMDGDGPWIIERLWPTLFDRPRPLRATFYCQATPVTTYLRCELPARYLPGKVSRECVLAQDEGSFWFPDHQGAAVFQFAGDAHWALMVHGLQSKGIRVLMEADDNYFAVGPKMKSTGWSKRKNQGAHSLEGHAAILKWVDGCIVTTEFLARQYRKHNPNVFVAPNTVDPIDWPTIDKPDDGVLRIGWFASNSHTEDTRLIYRAMEWASRQPGVEVLTMGYHPPFKFRHGHIPWQDLAGYREAMFQIDVGVAPVVPTPWSLCRSDLKAIEYAMGGALPVVSDVAPYDLFAHDENCIKVGNKPAHWLKAIQRVVQNREETKRLAAEAKRYVLAERTTQAQIGCWEAALDESNDEVRRAA